MAVEPAISVDRTMEEIYTGFMQDRNAATDSRRGMPPGQRPLRSLLFYVHASPPEGAIDNVSSLLL